MNVSIRAATATDTPLVLAFIRDLAKYEQLSSECHATEEQVRQTLFSDRPAAECLLAYVDNEPAGFAVFYTNYSTFLARPGLYVEDLFVKPTFRKRGVGRALMHHIAKLANERKCGRMEWTVLDWNEPAIEFYRGLGAQPLEEWRIFRLTGSALAQYA
jgi:GNAT superfamily N-acetyltransferase